MDKTDRHLLSIVQENSRVSLAEMSKQVGLSVSAVNERLTKLQTQGVIRSYAALLDPQALGLEVCAFIQILLDQPGNTQAFIKQILKVPQILDCHHISGEFSYLLKIRVRSIAQLETLLNKKIKSLPGVVRTQTIIALSTAKETTVYDLAE